MINGAWFIFLKDFIWVIWTFLTFSCSINTGNTSTIAIGPIVYALIDLWTFCSIKFGNTSTLPIGAIV